MKLNELTLEEKITIYRMIKPMPIRVDCSGLSCSICPYGVIRGECMSTKASRDKLLNAILDEQWPSDEMGMTEGKEVDAQ